MKTLAIVLFLQMTAPTIPATQGRVVVLELGRVSVSYMGPLAVFGRTWNPRRDGKLILGVPTDASTTLTPVIDSSGTTVTVLDVAKTTFEKSRVPIPEPHLARIPPKRERLDWLAKEQAYRTHADDQSENVRMRGPFSVPLSSDWRIPEGGAFGYIRVYRAANGAIYETQPHTGTDLSAPLPGGWNKHAPTAMAVAPGLVVLAQRLWLEGNTVIVYHGDGVYTAYCHLATLAVSVGDTLVAGHRLGAVGATGAARGPHLHLVMRINGILVDPLDGIAALNDSLR